MEIYKKFFSGKIFEARAEKFHFSKFLFGKYINFFRVIFFRKKKFFFQGNIGGQGWKVHQG